MRRCLLKTVVCISASSISIYILLHNTVSDDVYYVHMDDVTQSSSPSVFGTLFANAGWIVALGIVVWFFVFVKASAYETGFQQGVAEQDALDKSTYESVSGLANGPIMGTNVNLRVIRVQTGAILAETLALGAQNPFDVKPEAKTVVYSAATTVVRRVIITPDVYEQRILAAQERGENPSMIAPFDDVPATIADIQPGDRIEVELADATLAERPSFMAQSIAIVQTPVPQP